MIEPIEIVGSGSVGASDRWFWELEELFDANAIVALTTEQCKQDCDDKYDAAAAICRRQTSSLARASTNAAEP